MAQATLRSPAPAADPGAGRASMRSNGVSSPEVATSPSISAGCAASGFRSDDRASAVGAGLSDRDPPSGGAGRMGSEHRAATGRASPQHASRRRAGFRLCMLLRAWSPSNGDVGSLSMATSTTRAVGSVHTARIASRVRGRRVPVRALRSTNRRSPTVQLGTRVEAAALAQARAEGGSSSRRGGFQSAARVARDPSRIRRQGRTDVGRKLRSGEAAPAVRGGSHVDSRPRARLGFAPSPRATAIEAIPASATTLGRKRSGASRGRASAPTEAPRGRDLLRRGGSSPAGIAQWWQHQCAPRQRLSSGEKIQQHREIATRGRRSEGAAPSLLGSATDESRGARVPGQPGSRVSGVCWSSAHSQCFARRFRRDGGGNTAESDTMWVIGRVQSATAECRYGVGVYVEAAGWSWRSERAGFGSQEP
jgi:hypothetical protein